MGSVTNDAGTVLTWTLPAPGREERKALWQTALDDKVLAMISRTRIGTARGESLNSRASPGNA